MRTHQKQPRLTLDFLEMPMPLTSPALNKVVPDVHRRTMETRVSAPGSLVVDPWTYGARTLGVRMILTGVLHMDRWDRNRSSGVSCDDSTSVAYAKEEQDGAPNAAEQRKHV